MLAVNVIIFIFLSPLVNGFGIGSTLYCYQCISTHPGCDSPFNWLWHWSQACPEKDDRCVKLIERKGANEVITRDCLSSLKSIRTDIPADHYDGCRTSALDKNLAHYVNNSIKQLDIKRDYYEETTWCFCFFDNRCNSSLRLSMAPSLTFTSLFFSVYILIHYLSS